jgi:pilus assembly protein TadC
VKLSPRFAAALIAMGILGLRTSIDGLLLAILAWWLAPRFLTALESTSQRKERLRLQQQAPILAELLAAHLRGGAGILEALEAVATVVDGRLKTLTTDVAGLIRLGSTAPFQPWLEAKPLRPLARELNRSLNTGASMAAASRRAAQRLRSQALFAHQREIERLSVRLAAPVGLCFLPAFILIAVVPMVISLFLESGFL